MNTHVAPAALVAAAALCGLLANLAAASGSVPRHRARRLLGEPARRPGHSDSVMARLAAAVASLLRGTATDERSGLSPGNPRQGRKESDADGPAAAGPGTPPQILVAPQERIRGEESGPARNGTTGSSRARAPRAQAVRAPAGRVRAGTDHRPSKASECRAEPPNALPAVGELPTALVPLRPSPEGSGAGSGDAVPGAGGVNQRGVGPATRSVERLRERVKRRPELLCVPAGMLAGLMAGSLVPVAAGVAAVAPVGRVLRRRAERAAAERGAAAVSALCGVLAGDLRAGRPAHIALAEAVEAAGWARMPELAAAAGLLCSAARFGGDVPMALRAASRLHEGMRGLAAVAACWQVAVDGGAGLAAALDRLAAALRAESDQREDLRAQLAGPRSTAVLLALLPVFGVVLGAGLGADPSRVLLHTLPGLVCLCLGVALEWAGLAWTARIIRAAERGRRGHPKGAGMRRFRGRREP